MNKLIRSRIALRRPASLTAQLADELRGRIGRGELRPGDKFPSEQELMEAYGVSRTVVREAISSLKAESLVSTQQGVGAFVLQAVPSQPFRIDPTDLNTVKELIDILELRLSVEAETAALAAVRRSDQQLRNMRQALDQMGQRVEGDDHVEPDFRFHLELARATDNHFFPELFGYLGTKVIPRTSLKGFKNDLAGQQAYLQRVNNEHEDIYQAVAAQNPEAAREAMRRHLVNSRERLRAGYQSVERHERTIGPAPMLAAAPPPR